MKIFIDGKQAADLSPAGAQTEAVLYFATPGEKAQTLAKFAFPDVEDTRHAATRFESHNGFYYVSLTIPGIADTSLADNIEIYFSPETILIFHEHTSKFVREFIHDIEKSPETLNAPEEALYRFFVRLIDCHVAYLEDMEDEVTALEDSIVDNVQVDYVATISSLRKRLLALKRYYETLVALMEDLEENQNAMLSKHIIRLFHFQTQKADRLYHSVLNLRDYVTQVREAYQAQLDIQSNKVMKLFTVITAVFLPLTLIVGWYGMNFAMPEYESSYAYPIIIGISAAIIIGSIVYFKKNKWF